MKKTPHPHTFDGSYVHVTLPIGDTFHSRCTADIFTPGVVTVTSLDDPSWPPLRVYQPGQWVHVHVVGNGHPEFGFSAKEQ